MKPRPLKRVAKATRDRAINLRKNTTKPEQILWSILCGRQLDGLKFRRQHPIEPYVVDFYCAEASLIVELDGESHNGQEVHDKKRSDYLMKLGLNIFRVTNDEVLTNSNGVAEGIARVARLAQLKRR
jgi:very-short-patch-repair endonuclease